MTNKNMQGHEADHLTHSSEALIDKYKKPVMAGVAIVIIAVAGFFTYKNFVADPHA